MTSRSELPLLRRVGSYNVFAKPLIELLKPHSTGLVEVHQEQERLSVVEFQPVAVDAEKRSGHCDRNTFVAIDERMVLRETFLQRGSFLNDVTVVPAARSGQRRLQGCTIPQTGRPAETFD